MHASIELVDGHRRLEAIIAEFPADSTHWNEAQNRFQFVDRLLVECLGWTHPFIVVEQTDPMGDRADYVLGNPPKAVLEAKREARIFALPPAPGPNPVRKLPSLLKACKTLDEAVRQVIGYCSIRGAPIAVVCNGPQLIIFQGIVIGQSPLEGECYVFNGFESYSRSFPLLWSLLSPEGVAENRAYRELALFRNPRIPPKASTAISEPTKYRYRSQFQEKLRSLSSLLLEELEDDPDVKSAFYKECYVSLEANNRHLLLSKQIIASRYKRVTGDGVEPASLDSITAVEDPTQVNLKDSTADVTLGSRPVVVIGDVGVGKTSFFENLFQQLSYTEKPNTYFVHINLGLKSNLSAGIKSYVLAEIPTVLKNQYGIDIDRADFVNAIYHKDLDDFDKSVSGKLKAIDDVAYQKARIQFLQDKVNQRDTHLHASLGHLSKGRDKRIILIMDNADQRSYSVQQDAFLIAQELAATRNVMVFVALRPSTFYQSKMSGALSGYQNKVLTISPPPADEVLQRRIAFAVRVAEGKIPPAQLSGIRLQVKSIVLFLNATLRSIRSNESIRLFLSNITGGNTRSVIELITGFCGSPNVDSEKIVRIEDKEGDYKVPLHEFTKHALLGDYAYFNSQSSLVACNIFDISTAHAREHFLASMIISYLSSSLGIKDNDGFVNGRSILTEMLSHGFFDDQIRHALRRLAWKRLIETPHAHYREVEVEDRESPEQFHFRATSVGIYHVDHWTGSFQFLDATSTDTPIFDPDARLTIFQFADSFDIGARYKKTECFRQYLLAQWHLTNLNPNYFDFVTTVQSQAETFSQVQRFMDRSKGKSRVQR